MICYGIDIGTTTIRMVVSQVSFNSANERTVSVLSRKPLCAYTQFKAHHSLDVSAILQTIKTHVELEQFPVPDTGTILYTGEAQRSSNLNECTEKLSSLWPNLLSAQLSPEVESRLAAYGAGMIDYSKLHPGIPIIHFDIGGGTTNLARIENGEIIDTACLDLGCRKWILDPSTLQVLHKTQAAEALERLLVPDLQPIQTFNLNLAETLTNQIATLLLRYCKGSTESIAPFVVIPWSQIIPIDSNFIISLSGGIADCSSHESNSPFCFGDLGPLLLKSLKRQISNESHQLFIAPSTGRATVLGVAAHSFQLAGSSIFCSAGYSFPERNIRLIKESEFQFTKLAPAITSLSVYVDSLPEPSLDSINSLVNKFISTLDPMTLDKPFKITFIFQKNIAQTFGYLLQKQLPAGINFQFCALDEIPPPSKKTNLQLLDLSIDSESKRVLVRILEFAPF